MLLGCENTVLGGDEGVWVAVGMLTIEQLYSHGGGGAGDSVTIRIPLDL